MNYIQEISKRDSAFHRDMSALEKSFRLGDLSVGQFTRKSIHLQNAYFSGMKKLRKIIG